MYGNMLIDKKTLFQIVELDEIPDQIDISINLPKKEVPEPIYDTKKPKNTIALF